MNPLSPFIQTVIKNYSHAALERMYNLGQHPETNKVDQLGCSENQAYIIKRLINASLARDQYIKFNAYFALSNLLNYLPHLKNKINSVFLADYILTQTDVKKNCGGKPSEIQAYVIGKILIAKALNQLLADNASIINHLIELISQYPEFQEQLIQVVSSLVKSKKSLLAFSKINPVSKSGFVLFTIFRAELKGGNADLNSAVVDDVLNQLTPLYPKRSICLNYLGKKMVENNQWSKNYLKQKLKVAFTSSQQNFDFKIIFYLLQLLESYISSTVITSQNVSKILDSSLIEGWLSQMKVQNKYIRRQAQNITISFDNDPDMAFSILDQLHRDGVNLANMNIKHPLFPLLEMVEPEKYFEYLLSQCSKQEDEIDAQEQTRIYPLNQLQTFVSVRHKQLKAQSIAKAIELFIREYTKSKDQSHLQTLSRLFNSILPQNNKKKQQLFQKQSLVLLKIKIEQLELAQIEPELKDALKDIRKHLKQAKQQQHPLTVSYLNFMVAVGYYLLMYPEEVQIYSDLKMALVDIKKNFIGKSQGLIPKKKRKLNEEESKNKPIHVLVDIFISLLTKSPHFLRNSINGLFEQIIPFISTEDIGHLLEVINKPDQEYMEDVQNE